MTTENAEGLDRVLESAVIVSWADFMQAAKSGLLHLEYAFAPDSSVAYFKLGSSLMRGHWRLACQYSMSASTFHDQGIHFESGFRSEGLARNMELMMQHQQAFEAPPNLGRNGVLQIQGPTEEESASAAVSVREALSRVNSFSAAPLLA